MACPYAGKVPLSADQSATTTTARMTAAVVTKFGDPDVIQIRKVPVPQPKDNEVLIKVLTVGINPVDVFISEGNTSRAPPLPYIPCGDAAGFVQAVGSNVKNFQLGERVFTIMKEPTMCGGCAAYMAADQDCVFHLHDNISYSQAAALGIPYATAYKALFIRAEGKSGQKVLIHGASGGVGLAACQLAKAHGLTVFGTAGTEDGMEVVKNNGADAVFNHREKDYLKKIEEYTNGSGVDVILECKASKNLRNDLDLVARGGKIMVIGGGYPKVDQEKVKDKEAYLEDFEMFGTSKEDWSKMMSGLNECIEKGHIKPVIDQEFPLEELKQAFVEVLEHPQGSKGKIIVSV